MAKGKGLSTHLDALENNAGRLSVDHEHAARLAHGLPGRRMRLVTHLDVDAAGIERALSAFRSFFA